MSETTDNVPSIPMTPFVVSLMEQSARDTAWTTNAVIDGEKRRADRAEAELRLIRNGVYDLLDHPWTPSSDALREALHPAEEDIKELMERMG